MYPREGRISLVEEILCYILISSYSHSKGACSDDVEIASWWLGVAAGVRSEGYGLQRVCTVECTADESEVLCHFIILQGAQQCLSINEFEYKKYLHYIKEMFNFI